MKNFHLLTTGLLSPVAHTDADYQAALPGKPVKITLPEIMQCFKTLVHFDWVEELGRDLVADGVLDIPHEDFWVSSWPLDDPFIRGCATGLLDSFLHWWPIWCGHDVMTGRLGGRNFNYYSVMAPVYRGVLLKITYDDMCMVFDRKNLGGVVGLLQKTMDEIRHFLVVSYVKLPRRLGYGLTFRTFTKSWSG